MPLSQSLLATRTQLSDLLVLDLPTALKALKELLPESVEKHGLVIGLQSRLQLLNKDRLRGLLDTSEYAQRIAAISADFQDMLQELEEKDFEPPVHKEKKNKGQAVKQGSVLYRIPHKMPISKPSLCTVRVAVEEDDLLQDIVLDDNIRLRQRVEVSDRMSAELVDIEGQVFDIIPLNAAHQSIRDSGYTQWLFQVMPKIEGEHQLMVKISLLEFDQNTKGYLPREISIMETVTIVTESAAPYDMEEQPYKASGDSLAIGPNQQPSTTIRINRSLRAAALFFAFLIVSGTATWAVTPPPVRGLWMASWSANLSGSAQPFDKYIEAFRHDSAARPYLDKAFFRKAELTGLLSDLRNYQQEFADSGIYKVQVLERIQDFEAKAIESIKQLPTEEKVRQFLKDFPQSDRISEIVEILSSKPELESVLLELFSATETPVDSSVNWEESATLKKSDLIETNKHLENPTSALDSDGDGVADDKDACPTIKGTIANKGCPFMDRDNDAVPDEMDKCPDQKGDVALQGCPQETNPKSDGQRRQDNMVFVRGGSFEMGAENGNSNEKPVHTVILGDFYLSRFELTVGEYLAFCNDTKSHFPEWMEDGSAFNIKVKTSADVLYLKMGDALTNSKNPIVGISWNDAVAYCAWLSQKTGQKYRLPTEAEWEYAARGGKRISDVKYSYAGSYMIKDVAWYKGNSESKTHPVGEKKKNQIGLFDMSGNVYEWCADRSSASYPSSSQTNPGGPTDGAARILRGGSWYFDQKDCRVAFRYSEPPSVRKSYIGFRVAKTP